MDTPNPSARALLTAVVSELAVRDLQPGGQSGLHNRYDFRAMHLTQTVLDLLDLPTLAEQPALDLYLTIRARLMRLHSADLLGEDLILGLMAELRALFLRHHPALVERLPSKTEQPFA